MLQNAVELAMPTEMKTGEIVALRWSDINDEFIFVNEEGRKHLGHDISCASARRVTRSNQNPTYFRTKNQDRDFNIIILPYYCPFWYNTITLQTHTLSISPGWLL